MKFVAPEVSVKKFDVEDILTASTPTEATTEVSAIGMIMEGECIGNGYNDNAADNLVPECF